MDSMDLDDCDSDTHCRVRDGIGNSALLSSADDAEEDAVINAADAHTASGNEGNGVRAEMIVARAVPERAEPEADAEAPDVEDDML
ncbi:hypothetical protein HK405_000634, partial [Cladochytrium tenue]